MLSLQHLLQISTRDHDHLCPRQILGVRIGLAGMQALGYDEPPGNKRLLAIVESDGCFADGVSAATGCTVGHRTLRVEDYGKVAATLVHVASSQAVRVVPALDVRERAAAWVPDEPRRYFAQMQAYQTMPDDLLLTLTEVQLMIPVEQLISRPGVRVNCAICGEEIINEREIVSQGQTVCRACAGQSYYQTPMSLPVFSLQELTY
ncbi:MAG: FmdE family protein [Chloroflexi bacterium]|nr:FmdE family protein [Chloroflexota bacterium]